MAAAAAAGSGETKRTVASVQDRKPATELYLRLKREDRAGEVDMWVWLHGAAKIPLYKTYITGPVPEEKERIAKMDAVPELHVLMASEVPRYWRLENILCNEFAASLIFSENGMGPRLIDAWTRIPGPGGLVWHNDWEHPLDLSSGLRAEDLDFRSGNPVRGNRGRLAFVMQPSCNLSYFADNYGYPPLALEQSILALINRAHDMGISLGIDTDGVVAFGFDALSILYTHGEHGWRALSAEHKKFASRYQAMQDAEFREAEKAAAIAQPVYSVVFTPRVARWAMIHGNGFGLPKELREKELAYYKRVIGVWKLNTPGRRS